MKTYTGAELKGKTTPELLNICRELGVTASPEARPDVLCEAILERQYDLSTPGAFRDDEDARSPASSVAAPVAPTPSAEVRITCGASSELFPVAGQTVGQVRLDLADVLNIGADFEARVDGRVVGDSHVLVAGQACEFVSLAGIKQAF